MMMMTNLMDEGEGGVLAHSTHTTNNLTDHAYPIIPYRISDYSSYSAVYRPENILQDRPTDQASRWSSASNDQHQFVTLQLLPSHPLAIPLTITFGKFHKNHVCNLREFRVLVRGVDATSPGWVGSAPTNTEGGWVEVLQSGLRNDNEPECFPLVFPKGPFPVQQIKIHPLAAWGNSFNYSIWHVEVRGIQEPTAVATAARHYQERVWRESWRLCLKFLREQSIVRAEFERIQATIPVQLEASLVHQLHFQIVEEGNLAEAERILQDAHQADPTLFNEYLEDRVPYQPHWTRLDRIRTTLGPNGSTISNSSGDVTLNSTPCVRGGHQICWDPVTRSLYLFGGWDGHRDLGDFWCFSAGESRRWTLLSEDTRQEGGPGPRSCHKMILHPERRRLYVLGRYVDTETRTSSVPGSLQSDFYYYDLENHTWTLLASDTASVGGPGLVYDHQMALDEQRDTIYVFGGRLINGTHQQHHGATNSNNTNNTNAVVGAGEAAYGGLYAYSIRTDRWRLLRSDGQLLRGTPNVKSRIGHSMIFNPLTRHLYIYAGQRHKDYLCDFYIYDVDGDQIVEVIKDTSRVGGPEAGFTQRSTLDCARQELFIFSGLMREKSATSTGASNPPSITSSSATSAGSPSGEMARNSFWLYQIRKRKWIRIIGANSHGNQNNGDNNSNANNGNDGDEPCPRFAHQLVYDAEAGVHYLFGGNPGEAGNPRRRLDDFWQLSLCRPLKPADVLRQAMFALRKQQFYELCLQRRSPTADGSTPITVGSPSMLNAMRFLQTEVSMAVDHGRAEESQQFRDLSTWLVQPPGEGPVEELITQSRMRLFNTVVSFLPPLMRPPAESISDVIF